MTSNKEQNSTQPTCCWAFLKRRICTRSLLKRQLIFWPLVLVGVGLDLWSKAAAFKWLETQPNYTVSVIDGFFQLVMAENPGSAFGLAAGQRYFLVAFSIVALIMILSMLVFSATEHKMFHIALGLFAAGVCGNLYDRIFNDGLVRDFIDIYYRRSHWPAFNIADSMLCISVGLILISTYITEKSSRKLAQQHK